MNIFRVIPLLLLPFGLAACATSNTAPSAPAEPVKESGILPGTFYAGERLSCVSGTIDAVRYKHNHVLEKCTSDGWQPLQIVSYAKNVDKTPAGEPFTAPEEIIMPGRLNVGPAVACNADTINVVHYRADRTLEICGNGGWRPVILKKRPALQTKKSPGVK